MSRIRVGLESTKIVLTEVGKKWFIEHYPQGIVYEYDPSGTFDLRSMGADIEVICPMGIPYRFPTYIDGEITFNMADKEAETEQTQLEAEGIEADRAEYEAREEEFAEGEREAEV